jgi:hypothetical protein
MPPLDRHTVDQTENTPFDLQALTIGDQDFQRKMVRIYMDTFQDFKTSYCEALRCRNLLHLQDLLHKFRPAFHIIRVKALNQLIEKGAPLLQVNEIEELELSNLACQVEGHCDRIIEELQKVLLYLESPEWDH